MLILTAKILQKKRMYLDTMDRVYHSSTKIIIDNNMVNNILPFLALNKINE